ncbi:hypothetical protein JK358_37270 [Nocardia sp. 2]|uniref:DUF1449 family protein n=2 Tax=Nocardia acididurans TaxID=2802282 RepID=A0ABS1ML98_9NOCA|nr:hypothetical protein [Nocardia acididurans]MBL1080063.1 hypothetical protein [Nocardia acididurans]
MSEFLTAATSFPTVLFTFTLMVVAGYWLAALIGAVDSDLGGETDAAEGLGRYGLGGVPVTLVISILVAFAWLLCLIGSIAVSRSGFSGGTGVLAGFVVLIAACGLAVVAARAVVLPLRRLFESAPAPRREDFLGRRCVIRTGSVGTDFGQAELISSDGSSAIVQVRQTVAHAAEKPLAQGSSAIVYDYDTAAEVFWVAAFEEGI